MKTIEKWSKPEFKSTKGGKFNINVPDNYEKRKLPFFKKWVSALESGTFRQCTGTLCDSKNSRLTYCCLGVLSKIQGRLIKNNVSYEDKSETDVSLNDDNPCYDVLAGDGTFPCDVYVGRGDGDFYKRAWSLISCNDDLGLSFKDIAKIIKTLYKA